MRRSSLRYRGGPRSAPSILAAEAARGYTLRMGLTVIPLEIASAADPSTVVTVDCLVDSGATYSVIPRPILAGLGIEPLVREKFRLADGQIIERDKGGAVFRYAGRVGVSDVVFGENGDAEICGAFTLEALGLALDPLKRELRPIQLLI
jgi:aspartyl protease family protein